MISRRTTRWLAEAYIAIFSSDSGLDLEELADFIYDEEYENWFWNIFLTSQDARLVKQRILNLHTGDTLDWFKTPFSNLRSEERIRAGQDYLRRLAQSLLRQCAEAEASENSVQITVLLAYLELDGYVYKDGILYATEHSVIDETEERSYLELLIGNANLPDTSLITHHLQLSEQAYIDSRWNDTISNARNFLEAILSQVAEGLQMKKNGSALPIDIAARPVEIRKHLEREGLINGTEREALARIYGLISNTGSHPNMAHKDQARLMRNLALTFSQYILLQWEGYLKNNP